MISVKTFMHQKQTLAKIKLPEKWHPPPGAPPHTDTPADGGGGAGQGMGGGVSARPKGYLYTYRTV